MTMQAILEVSMPDSCVVCPVGRDNSVGLGTYCAASKKVFSESYGRQTERAEFCPLKAKEGLEASEYLRKCAIICRLHEPDGCLDCPLKPFTCGVPLEASEQAEALKIVEEYERPLTPYVCPQCKAGDHAKEAKFCRICGLAIQKMSD